MTTNGDTTKTRILFRDGRIIEYDDYRLAYSVYLSLPKHVRAAFRGAGDKTPVYNHEYVTG